MMKKDKPESLQVWDLPTRLFHWTLLGLVVACWWTATEDGDIDWHMRCGYAVLALLLFRLAWGVLGSTTARFASFVASPRLVFEYLANARKNDITHIGHNPAGGWMVLVLLAMLLAISLTGLFANDDIMSEGPLAHRVSKGMSDLATAWHEHGFHALLALVALHVAAIVFYLVVKRDNLVRPMLTGVKHLPQAGNVPQLHMRSIWLALAIMGGAAGTVWLLTKFA
ncbi:MAG: cytochrome b/b6 domain-containing protein [Gammaproteobacteria bacterium]|nr:cytochrome b/b6 domain-containing protein [Gammaproteobacteria bacterium]MBU1777121.1 cytochrome b/b6 domain-containing protein [Gammaproteobacteria bacterium]MBU1967805.1 cytochrome b/b6 domain-containing protein [Gammaproteobacteria bacterium]